MKKYLLFIFFIIISGNYCNAQEWFTSFDIAKRMALTKNKMLFVVWDASFDGPYPILLRDDRGKTIVVDLSENKRVDPIIWDYFVPVFLSESKYDEMVKDLKGKRTTGYIDKFSDDSIKIMDVNGNIINTNVSYEEIQNLSNIIKYYALNTTFLKQEFINYSKHKDLNTTFNLAVKYIDFAVYAEEKSRPEILNVANIYFDEAMIFLEEEEPDKKAAVKQRFELLLIKEQLILNKGRKAKRLLKKMETSDIAKLNNSLYNFLNYTTFKLLKDKKNVALWEHKISGIDLKKASLIININK